MAVRLTSMVTSKLWTGKLLNISGRAAVMSSPKNLLILWPTLAFLLSEADPLPIALGL